MASIALLHYSAPPIIGGVENVIEQQANLFANAGHSVRIIAGRGEVFDRRVRFISIPLADSQNSLVLAAKTELDAGRVPANFNLLTDKITNRLAAALEGVDVLIAHNVCSLHKNLALTAAVHRIAAQILRIRVIAWHHDIASLGGYGSELYKGFPWNLITSYHSGVTHVTISHTRQKQLSQLFNIPTEEIRVIPNGIDAAQFLSLGSHAQQLVDQFNLLLADPLLLLPARLTRRKNIPFAIHAISGLRDRMPKVRLLVTGPPGPHNPKNIEYFNELLILRKSLNLEQHVLFLAEHAPGFISGRTVQDLYKLADALFLPSLEEGFGLPILEAGLTGLPIFCSQIAPFEEILGKDAYYFDPKGDPSRASDLIAEQLNGNLTYRLRKRIQGLYSWSGIYRNHLQSLVES